MLCQVKTSLLDGPAIVSPTFPQCTHRFSAVFTQVIHMLSTAKLAVNSPAVGPDPPLLPCVPAAQLPGKMSPPVLGAPFVPVLSYLSRLGRIAVIEVSRRKKQNRN